MPQDNQPDMQLVVFQATEGEVQFLINGDKDTLWGTRQQIAGAFGCTEDNVRKHIRNIYEERELDESATSEKISEVQTDTQTGQICKTWVWVPSGSNSADIEGRAKRGEIHIGEFAPTCLSLYEKYPSGSGDSIPVTEDQQPEPK